MYIMRICALIRVYFNNNEHKVNKTLNWYIIGIYYLIIYSLKYMWHTKHFVMVSIIGISLADANLGRTVYDC